MTLTGTTSVQVRTHSHTRSHEMMFTMLLGFPSLLYLIALYYLGLPCACS